MKIAVITGVIRQIPTNSLRAVKVLRTMGKLASIQKFVMAQYLEEFPDNTLLMTTNVGANKSLVRT